MENFVKKEFLVRAFYVQGGHTDFTIECWNKAECGQIAKDRLKPDPTLNCYNGEFTILGYWEKHWRTY